MLLALAEAGPMKGYEFIAELDRLFGPAYRASPGGVYPAIAALTAERLLKAESDGRAKRYWLTDAGRKALDQRRRQLAAVEARTGARLREEGSLGPMLDRFVERVMQRSGIVEPRAVEAVLEKAADEIERIEGGLDGQGD